jgi:hypothetical protein
VSLWLNHTTQPIGPAAVTLSPGGAGAGSSSVCGNGIAYQNLDTDLCVDGEQPGTGNFTIPDQKVVYSVYSTDMNTMANFTNQGRCNPPECFIQHVLIPAAMAMDAAAANIQVQVATSVLPADAPGTLGNATVDSLIFAFTTQALDMDLDGIEDRSDPCPNDGLQGCLTDVLNGGTCDDAGGGTHGAGKVLCSDIFGGIGCIDSFLCNQRGDSNQDCLSDSLDFNRTGGGDYTDTSLCTGVSTPFPCCTGAGTGNCTAPNGMNAQAFPNPVFPAFGNITIGPFDP